MPHKISIRVQAYVRRPIHEKLEEMMKAGGYSSVSSVIEFIIERWFANDFPIGGLGVAESKRGDKKGK